MRMFLEARTLPSGTELEADLCIVGAGAAGISLALALDESPLRVLLVESGSFDRKRETQALYAGRNVGLDSYPLEESRSRFFGGSTNCWGGWCKTFDPIDFEERAWLGVTGWPFGLEQLEPYHARAAPLLQVAPLESSPREWELSSISSPKARLLRLDDGAIENRIAQFSPPARFGRLYREPIRRSQNIRVVLNANLVEIETDESATTVIGLRLASLAGTTFSAHARAHVLAMGGIENARLLLLSNKVATGGLGNANDLVGRFFMDHPRVVAGNFTPAPSAPGLDFYDVTYNVRNKEMMANGICAAAFMSVRPEVQRDEQLLNSRVCFESVFAGEEAQATEALRRVRAAAKNRELARTALKELPTILRDVGAVAHAVEAHFLRPARLLRARRLITIIEPDPNPDSRVTLSTECDALGLPRAIVDWRLGPHTERSLRRVQQLVAAELARRGLGELVLTEDDPDEKILGAWHHMGTTRMSDNPATGVVNADCRIHGMNNLYITGSSIFPTVSSDMPTVMIVALALRLADHLRDQLTRRPRVPMPSSGVPPAPPGSR